MPLKRRADRAAGRGRRFSLLDFQAFFQEGKEVILELFCKPRRAISRIGKHENGVGKDIPAVGLPDKEEECAAKSCQRKQKGKDIGLGFPAKEHQGADCGAEVKHHLIIGDIVFEWSVERA